MRSPCSANWRQSSAIANSRLLSCRDERVDPIPRVIGHVVQRISCHFQNVTPAFSRRACGSITSRTLLRFSQCSRAFSLQGCSSRCCSGGPAICGWLPSSMASEIPTSMERSSTNGQSYQRALRPVRTSRRSDIGEWTVRILGVPTIVAKPTAGSVCAASVVLCLPFTSEFGHPVLAA